jgi:hypothetical protein
MFGSRQTLGGTLSAGNSSLFGSRTGTTPNAQAPGFVGRGNQSADPGGNGTQDGRHFVGAVRAGAKSATAGLAGAEGLADGAVAGARRVASANAASGMLPGQQGARTATRVPVKLQIGFEYHAPSAAQVSTRLAQRLAAARSIHALAPIQVEVQGRTAILRGSVASQHDRDLAGQLARLEAEIAAVNNEIVVAGSSPPAAKNPAK